MGHVGLFILLFAVFKWCLIEAETKSQCKFTSTNGFYAHVPSNFPIGDVIFRGSVVPSDAEMMIANVRSDALKETDWSDHFVIDQTGLSPGSYLVRLSASLSLPVYPSTLKEANLFVTVVCNGYAYPLFTVHIDPTNRFAPQFYHEPYVVAMDRNLPLWTVLDTPVAAIDWDPQDSYALTFWLEDSHKGIGLVEQTMRPKSKDLISGSADWPEHQLPSRVQLRITGTYELPMTLRLIVSDNAKENPRRSTTFINLIENIGKTENTGNPETTVTTLPPSTTTTPPPSTTVTTTTTVVPTTTTTTTVSTVSTVTTVHHEEIEDSKVTKSSAQHISELKKELERQILKISKIVGNSENAQNSANSKPSHEIDFVAFGAKNREMNAIETDNSEEIEQLETFGPTRFAHCSLRTSVAENSPKGTKVAHLEVLNRRNSTQIRLIDPDGTFAIDKDTDDVIILDPKIVDRELFSTLELVVEIQNADPSVQCTRIRVYVDLDDENDNRPVFENEHYFFHIDRSFPPGREIGKLLAQDIDQGSNGQITYHLLTENVPFQVGTLGKKGVIMSTGKVDPTVVSYKLTVEARDHGEELVKSAKVPVEIFVLGGAKAEGVKLKPSEEVTALPDSDADSEDVEVVTEIVEVFVEDSEEVPDDMESENPEIKETTTSTTTSAPLNRRTTEETPEDGNEGVTESSDDVTESEDSDDNITTTTPIPENTESHTTSERTPSPSEDVNKIDDVSDEVDVLPPAPSSTVFAFPQTEYTYDAFGMEIQENDVLGKVDAGPKTEVYAVGREVIGLIKVNEAGELLAGKNLNRRKDGPLKFEVSATNGFETTHAQVTVFRDANRDVMSAMPRFDRDVYRFAINENQQPEVIGFVRAFHSAISSSESVHLTYSLIAPAHIDELPFEIHEQSGEVSTLRPLDAEQNKFYRFQVRACLTQTICSSSDVIVEVIDVNDSSPVLVSRKLEATVESDVPPGTKIVKLIANDADSGNNSRLTFWLNSETDPFTIDANTGQLSTSQSLTQPLYTLMATVSDHGVPRRSDTAEVTVVVKGTNPSPPAFDQSDYKAVIAAPVRAGQVIGEVHATDPDPGAEGQVVYRLLKSAGSEDHRKFMINSKTGVISAITPLALGDGPIELMVEASDNGKNLKRKVKTSMTIEIIDSKTLRFLPLPTSVYISTEKAVGSVVLRVSAVSTDNENIKFRALQENSQFVMDGDLLRVANHLVEGESVLSIRAETDTTHVDHPLRVIVMSDRDKYPVFPQLTYDFDVSTDGHFPRVVHQFNAKVGSGALRYTFFPPSPAPQGFYLDDKTGELFVTSQFPKSTRETVFVVVRAVNLQATSFYSDVGVAITPISTTNPTLRFQQPTYNFEVYENLKEGDPIGTISVTGATSPIEFSVSPDNSFLGIHQNGTLFLAHPVDAEDLEDALLQEFTVMASSAKVDASQPSEVARARIQVAIRDVNEFQPEFDEDDVELSIERQEATPGAKIGRVVAHDKDVSEKKKLIYRVVGGAGRKLVFIQEDGTIIVGDEPIPGDLEEFDLIIEAVDKNGNHDSTHVIVYIDGTMISAPEPTTRSSEGRPSFIGQPLVWNVTEGTTEGFDLQTTTGASNDLVEFRIIGGDPDGHFGVVQFAENKTAVLRILSELDRRRQKSFTLQLEAKNSRNQMTSLAQVVVNVEPNSNEHAPTFSKAEYSETIVVDLPIGSTITTIEATDVDRDSIQFQIQGDSCNSELGIDDKGRVFYKVSKELRTRGTVVCVIVASDGQHNSDTTLILEVKERNNEQATTPSNHAPTFSNAEYTFTVSQNSSEVGTVAASDPDNDIIAYSIEPAEYRNLFHVDSQGRISVKEEQLEQSRYSFLVVAEDRGRPMMSSFVNVKVTVVHNTEQLDNEVTIGTLPPTVSSLESIGRTASPAPLPQFEFTQNVYSWRIKEGFSVGSVVGTIRKTGSPTKESDVKYSFISGEHLAIDDDGRVTVTKPFTSTINDVVIASRRSEILAETRVFVGVEKDARQETSPATVTPAETTETSESVESKKPATPLRHTLTPTVSFEDITGFGESEEGTTTSSHPATLAPTDPPTQAATARIIPITVPTAEPFKKFSFTSPFYSATSAEGQYTHGIELEVRPPLMTTFGSRQDAPVTYSIEDTTSQLPFFLTADGKLIMFEADRERHGSYLFTILAKTSSKEGDELVARSRLNVTILDVNDNYPKFEKHPSVVGVSRTMHVGSPIYQMKANDIDSNAEIFYGLTDGSAFFSIDPKEGLIRVGRPLESVTDDKLSVTVTARDTGTPSLKSNTSLVIQLFKNPLGPPTFSKSSAPDVTVTNSTAPQTEVATLLAGPTVSEQDKILYRLEDTVNGLFEIRHDGNLVLTRRPLDNEAGKRYVLNLTAENSKGVDWVEIPVFVESRLQSSGPTPTPFTASPPSCQFTQKVYRAQVRENSIQHEAVIRVRADCRNAHQKFRYAFHTQIKEFEIDSQSGQIYTTSSLDRETRSTYFLTVNVIEQNRLMVKRQSDLQIEQIASKLSSWQTVVVVSVLDENDNAPVFLNLLSDSSLAATVDQNANLMTPVAHLQARDLDITPGHLKFDLEGEDSRHFHINSTSGLIQLTTSLEKTHMQQFSMQATVSDGKHTAHVPLNIYVLSVDTNVVQLTKDSTVDDPSGLEKKLTEVVGMDTRILVAQPYVSDDGKTDYGRSHVFVYAIDVVEQKPISRDELKRALMKNSDGLHPLNISSVSLLSTGNAGAASHIVLTIVLMILLIALLLFICALILFCAKRRGRRDAVMEGSYMIGSIQSGPRPYDVEKISRLTAQTVLAGRPLPDPIEHRIDTLPATEERDDFSREFSNSVRERPSLIQNAQQQKIATISQPSANNDELKQF